MTPARLKEILGRARSKRILVIGDLMLDEFVLGKVTRISPEAPVPVVEVTRESFYPGGAANVARNLREFSRNVAVIGMFGSDHDGQHLAEVLARQKIDTAAAIEDKNFQTIKKTRIIARNQQVVRVDREQLRGPSPAQVSRIVASVRRRLSKTDAVIFEDYGKGFLSAELVRKICEDALAARKIVTADPNPNHPIKWKGVSAVKPNRNEAFLAAGLPWTEPVEPPTKDKQLLKAGKRLLAKWQTEVLLITLGEHGMMLFERGEKPHYIPTKAREVYDVSGAGDTAIALFTLALCCDATPIEAAEIANHASAVVVGKLGTATVTPDELGASFENDRSPNESWPAVFLDRDGTLMEDVDYCGDPANVHVYPGAGAALRRLKESGYKLVIITNQSGIGRGYFGENEYRAVEAEFVRQLGDGLIDASYYCPELPTAASIRRKPGPGMIFEAQRDHGIDLRRSFFVGDKASDIGCGVNAGVRTILVQTGYGAGETNCHPDWIARDIVHAADIILEQT